MDSVGLGFKVVNDFGIRTVHRLHPFSRQIGSAVNRKIFELRDCIVQNPQNDTIVLQKTQDIPGGDIGPSLFGRMHDDVGLPAFTVNIQSHHRIAGGVVIETADFDPNLVGPFDGGGDELAVDVGHQAVMKSPYQILGNYRNTLTDGRKYFHQGALGAQTNRESSVGIRGLRRLITPV